MKSTNLSCSKASSVTKGVLWSKVAAAAQSPAAATSCSNIPSPCSSSSNQNSLTSGSGSQKKLVSTDSKVATNESREPQQQSFSPFAIKICLLCKTPIKFFDNNGEQVTLKSAGNRAQMTLCNHIFHKEVEEKYSLSCFFYFHFYLSSVSTFGVKKVPTVPYVISLFYEMKNFPLSNTTPPIIKTPYICDELRR